MSMSAATVARIEGRKERENKQASKLICKQTLKQEERRKRVEKRGN